MGFLRSRSSGSVRKERNRNLAGIQYGIDRQQPYASAGEQAMGAVRGLLAGGLGDDEHFKRVADENMRLEMNELRASGKSRAPRAFSEALGRSQLVGFRSALKPYGSRINRSFRAAAEQAEGYAARAGEWEKYAAHKRAKKGNLLGGTAQAVAGYFSGDYMAMAEGIGTATNANSTKYYG